MTEPSKKKKPVSLGKIILDTSCLQQQSSGSGGACPVEKFLYVLFIATGVLYAAHVADRERFSQLSTSISLGFISDLFVFIDKYSPFNEMFETDEELLAKLRGQSERVFSQSELAKYDGSAGSPGLLLALLGVVYDVSKAPQYYGPQGGYAFFAGRDASRAFVTGKFDSAGLVDNVEGLASSDYLGLAEWSSFYSKDYSRVGVLAGRFYDEAGQVTQDWRDLQDWTAAAEQDRQQNDVERRMFPPCNVEWSQAEGSRFWCTTKSGGVTRDWVGVPRQLFYPGREARCACVRSSGAPSTDPGASSERGDRDNPHVKLYPGCEELAHECRTQLSHS